MRTQLMMDTLILLLLIFSSCSCKPVLNEGVITSDRMDLLGLRPLLIKNEVRPILGTPTNAIKEPGYYPDFKQYGREQAVLEHEHWISKVDSVYNKAQKKAADYLNLKPIVDTIHEHEKYGNDGEQYRVVGKTLVNGFDAIGKTINNVIDLSFRSQSYFGKTINAALNAVGSKLVGI